MKKKIECEADIKAMIEEGMSPEEVSLIHWRENLELMNMNQFKKVQYDGHVCALCYVYNELQTHCEKCPLKILTNTSCKDADSVWRPIHNRMKEFLELSDEKPANSERLDRMCNIYDLKLKIKESTMKMIATLEKCVENENERRKNEFRKIGRTVVLTHEYSDGKGFDEEYVELNDTGIFVPKITIVEDIFRIVDKNTGEVYYGQKEHDDSYIMENTRPVVSHSDPNKEYIISWKHDTKTGESFGGKCSCPAFTYKMTRPCKHMMQTGLTYTYTDDVIDNRSPWKKWR